MFCTARWTCRQHSDALSSCARLEFSAFFAAPASEVRPEDMNDQDQDDVELELECLCKCAKSKESAAQLTKGEKEVVREVLLDQGGTEVEIHNLLRGYDSPNTIAMLEETVSGIREVATEIAEIVMEKATGQVRV